VAATAVAAAFLGRVTAPEPGEAAHAGLPAEAVDSAALASECMVTGGALTGHIPGGPGLTTLTGALAFALLARVRRDGMDVDDSPTALH